MKKDLEYIKFCNLKVLVTIVVPCYNQAQYLDEALQSVLEQTFSNWECIIVNDGSFDNTKEIAEKWLRLDKRFTYLFSENKGVSNARNIGILQARGTYILPLDADDKIGTTYLESAVSIFTEKTNIKLVYCKATKFGKINEIWELPEFTMGSLATNNIIFSSAIFLKSDWEKIGGYDVNMVSGLEDWEFWIALLKNGGVVHRIDENLFFYRVKISSRQSDLSNDKMVNLFEYLSIKHADFFVNHYGSFKKMEEEIFYTKWDYENKLSSKKFILHLFIKTFFKIKLFKRYEN